MIGQGRVRLGRGRVAEVKRGHGWVGRVGMGRGVAVGGGGVKEKARALSYPNGVG